jgi:hypothetical protein
MEKALSLVKDGVLEPLLFLPLEFGGTDDPLNLVYVPVGFAALKHNHDMNVIRPLVQEGLIEHYAARPTYEGRSFIPTSIVIHASNPREITYTLCIWGSALTENDAAPPDTAATQKKPWWKFW